MSMVFGYILNGVVYIAADEQGSSYDTKTGEHAILNEKVNKIVQLDRYTVLATAGICPLCDSVQHMGVAWWQAVNGNINEFAQKVAELGNAFKNSLTLEEFELSQKQQFGFITAIIGHYDIQNKKPILYGFTDFDNYQVKILESNTGTIAKSALPDNIMWPVINSIRGRTMKEYLTAVFTGCHALSQSISSTFKLRKIDERGVLEVC